jgi:XTP/dITP diphosphohydrolase
VKRQVVLASSNEGKLRELRALLPHWDLEPLVADYPEETGSTFYDNARGKTRFARSVVLGEIPVLGEDSGLEVEALGGRPGVRSARYAGPDASDEDNVELLLRELAGVPDEARGARYVSELVLHRARMVTHGRFYVFRGTGTLEGRISTEPLGSEGFGYDPVFIPSGEERTVAELGDAWKREHSHRAQAAKALLAEVGKLGERV